MLKLVASTKIFQNYGNAEVAMWRTVGGNEYIIARFEEKPTWEQIGEACNKFMHALEGKTQANVTEIFAGFDMFDNDSLTHSEHFQLEQGGTIDFPAEDLTRLDIEEHLKNAIEGN